MGEVVNFPKAKGGENIRASLSDHRRAQGEESNPSPGRVVERGASTQPGKRPSWGVFDDHDGDTPDAA